MMTMITIIPGKLALSGETAKKPFNKGSVDDFMVYGADVGRIYKVEYVQLIVLVFRKLCGRKVMKSP